MSLRVLTRKTKMSLIPSEEDICKLLFTRRKQQRACRLLLDWFKECGACTRSELSKFAWDLEAGKIEKGFKYRRTSFYRQIRKPLLTLGLITIEQRFGELIVLHAWMGSFGYGSDLITCFAKTLYDLEGNVLVCDEFDGHDVSLRLSSNRLKT